MSLSYLLDTNILSEPLKPNPEPSVLGSLQRHSTELATATVVWHELWFGCNRLPDSRKRRAIEHYLNDVVQATIPLLPYDQQAATWHADERVRLTAIGKVPSFADGQIAAIARTNNLILVTRNLSDYENFADLQLENWYAPDR